MTNNIDLRKELQDFFFGSTLEEDKSHKVLVRRFKYDPEGRKIPCTCNKDNEGAKTPSCSSCLGEGYYWKESWESCFKYHIGSESAHARRIILEAGGTLKGELCRFYFQHDIDITKEDRIVEVKYDNKGDISLPYKRGTEWMIQEVINKRSDQGRVEFTTAYCSKSNIISNSYSRR